MSYKLLHFFLLFNLIFTIPTYGQIPKNIKRLYDLDTENKQIFMTNTQNQLQVWDITKNKAFTFSRVPQNMLLGKIAPNGQYFLLDGTDKKEAWLFAKNSQAGAILKDGHSYDITCFDFSPNSKLIATGGLDQQLVLWNLKGQQLKNWEVGDMPILTLAFSPNNTAIATGDMDNDVKVWKLDGTLESTFTHDNEVFSLVFSENGEKIMVGTRDKKLHIWNSNGTKDKVLSLDFLPNSLKLNANNNVLVLSKNGRAKLMNVGGAILKTYEGKPQEILNDFFEVEEKPIVKEEPKNEEKPIVKEEPKNEEKPIVNKNYEGKMILVEGSTFMMGNENGYENETPEHSVILSSFYLSQYEITNEEFALFLNNYGGNIVKEGKYQGKKIVSEDDWGIYKENDTWKARAGYESHPIINITWYGANEFCKFYGGRLPTEAEWEYAARGGQKHQGFEYSGNKKAETVAWYSKQKKERHTHKVGTKIPNELDFYDMSGNVWEWCQDWYQEDYYSSSPEANPVNTQESKTKVLRGGSWLNAADFCRNTSRAENVLDIHSRDIGFRFCKPK